MTDVRPKRHTWDDLRTSEPLSADEQLIDLTFFAVFVSPQGQKALEFMHLLTTWKRNAPGDSDGALRELEAQRRFVAIIEARIERHQKRIANKSGGRTEHPEPRTRQRRSRAGHGGGAS